MKPLHELEVGEKLYNRHVGECYVWDTAPVKDSESPHEWDRVEWVTVGYEAMFYGTPTEERVFFRADPWTEEYFGDQFKE